MNILASPRMRMMLPQIIWTGASIAYWSGLLTPIMTLAQTKDDPDKSENEVLQNCLFAFIFFGIGQALSGLAMGKLIDITSSKQACIYNVFVMLLVTAASIFNLQRLEFSWLSCLTLFIWGFQDGMVNTHSFQMLGFEFETQSDPFAIFTLVQGIAVFIFQNIQGQLNTEDPEQLKLYTYVNNSLGIVCLFSCYFFDFRKTSNPATNVSQILQSTASSMNNPTFFEQQKLLLINSNLLH